MNITPKPDTKAAEDDFMNASGGYSGSATNAPEPQPRPQTQEAADPAAAPSADQADPAAGSAWNFPEKEPTVRLSVFLPISVCMAIKCEAKSRKVAPQIIVEEMARKCLTRWIQTNS